jgi:hypothetical protein
MSLAWRNAKRHLRYRLRQCAILGAVSEPGPVRRGQRSEEAPQSRQGFRLPGRGQRVLFAQRLRLHQCESFILECRRGSYRP